jgi:hypothetical protein
MKLFWSTLILACALLAQGDRGTITGIVADPGGALVPSASVTAKNTETGTTAQTVTTATGNFTLPGLAAGVYEVTVNSPGFGPHVQTGVRVQVAQTVRLDISLKISTAAETVTVSADAPLLNTERADQTHTISREQFNSLPLNFSGGSQGGGAMRNPLIFARLAPGANVGNGTNQVKVNGMATQSYTIILDGMDATNGNTQQLFNNSQPSVDAIEEFALQTSNFAAEFGQVSGGLFNFTTRSGTNNYHGAVYDYFVNEALNAGQPFTDDGSGRHIVQKNRRQDFGFNVGGPVRIPKLYNGRNRTFFFFNYEYYWDRRADTSFATVPTDAYRNGDFSAAIANNRVLGTDPLGRPIVENTIYDPLTASTVNGLIVRNPFPGNRIPSARFDPVALRIQELIPKANISGTLFNNYQRPVATPKTSKIPSVKIDHNFSPKTRVAGYYQYWNNDQLSGPDGLPVPITARRDQFLYSQTLRLNATHTLSPTVILTLGAGIQRLRNPDSSPPSVLTEFDPVKELGLKGSSTGGGFPRITGLSSGNFGGMSLGMGPSNGNNYLTTKPTATTSLSWIRNNHTFKFGGDFQLDAFTNRKLNGTTGDYTFGPTQTGLPSVQQQPLVGGSVGMAYASFLLGLVNSATIQPVEDPQFRRSGWGLYAQDTWKVTRRLTLDIGLRWDYVTANREIWDRWSAFSPLVANPSAGNLLGGTIYEGNGPGRCNCRFTDTYPYAIGPRLGAAYQLTSKTVLRLGYGISYAKTANTNYFGGAMIGLGYNTIPFDSPTYAAPALQLRDGLNYNPADLNRATFDPAIRPSPGQINSPPALVDRNGGRPGRIQQWNISLQREITPNLVAEAAYVGNRGVWLQGGAGLATFNALSPQRLAAFGIDVTRPADQTLLRSTISSSTAQARGFRAPYPGFPGTATVAQSLRPFPQFGDLNPMYAPLGNSWYDSLQVKVTKRHSYGLTLTAAFTWQKELGRGVEAGGINDVFNRANQKSFQSSSIPLTFVTGFSYEVPGLRASRVVRALASGWTVSGTLRYSSGMPIAVPGSNNNLGSLLFQSTRMNRVPGEPLFLKDLNCHCVDPYQDLVLNPKAWSDPAQGQWGFSAPYYDDYRQARRPTEEIGVGRIFRVGEGKSIQFRAEAFNAFNRVYLNSPTSGNPAASVTRNARGELTGGFGFINPASVAQPARNAQLLLRVQF